MTALATDYERIDVAQERAVQRANREHDLWLTVAEAKFHRFIMTHKESFLMQEFALWAEGEGLQEPSNSRVYGALATGFQRQGWIVPVGYGRDKFGSPKTLWRAAT